MLASLTLPTTAKGVHPNYVFAYVPAKVTSKPFGAAFCMRSTNLLSSLRITLGTCCITEYTDSSQPVPTGIDKCNKQIIIVILRDQNLFRIKN
jgi:hypothetical protein